MTTSEIVNCGERFGAQIWRCFLQYKVADADLLNGTRFSADINEKLLRKFYEESGFKVIRGTTTKANRLVTILEDQALRQKLDTLSNSSILKQWKWILKLETKFKTNILMNLSIGERAIWEREQIKDLQMRKI